MSEIKRKKNKRTKKRQRGGGRLTEKGTSTWYTCEHISGYVVANGRALFTVEESAFCSFWYVCVCVLCLLTPSNYCSHSVTYFYKSYTPRPSTLVSSLFYLLFLHCYPRPSSFFTLKHHLALPSAHTHSIHPLARSRHPHYNRR